MLPWLARFLSLTSYCIVDALAVVMHWNRLFLGWTCATEYPPQTFYSYQNQWRLLLSDQLLITKPKKFKPGDVQHFFLIENIIIRLLRLIESRSWFFVPAFWVCFSWFCLWFKFILWIILFWVQYVLLLLSFAFYSFYLLVSCFIMLLPSLVFVFCHGHPLCLVQVVSLLCLLSVSSSHVLVQVSVSHFLFYFDDILSLGLSIQFYFPCLIIWVVSAALPPATCSLVTLCVHIVSFFPLPFVVSSFMVVLSLAVSFLSIHKCSFPVFLVFWLALFLH